MKHFLFVILIVGWIGHVVAEDASNLVIKIPETFYKHPTRLNHPRVDHWHNQGKVAESAGLASFKSPDSTVSNCQANANGKALIVIVPSMFFNQQRGTFHSEIIARIYTVNTSSPALIKPALIKQELAKPELTIKGMGQVRGWLSPNSDKFTYESYLRAFDEVNQQLKKNANFQAAISQSSTQDYTKWCEQADELTRQELLSKPL